MKNTDKSYALSRCYSSLLTHNTARATNAYVHGYIKTPEGIVGAYVDRESTRKQTILDFVFQARTYQRRFPRVFSYRGLAIVARRFAVDVINGDVNL